jgi:hypothetical protein
MSRMLLVHLDAFFQSVSFRLVPLLAQSSMGPHRIEDLALAIVRILSVTEMRD